MAEVVRLTTTDHELQPSSFRSPSSFSSAKDGNSSIRVNGAKDGGHDRRKVIDESPRSPSSRQNSAPGLLPFSQIKPIILPAAQTPPPIITPDGLYQRKISQPLRPPEPSSYTTGQSSSSFRANGVAKSSNAQHGARSVTSSASNLNSRSFPQLPAPRPLRHATTPSTRSRALSNGSSSSETETEVDSDSTFVPGRSSAMKSKKSMSQPDLVALRSRLGDWAGQVARGQEEVRKAREGKRRTTPPAKQNGLPSSSPGFGPSRHSRSSSSLSRLRQSPSPRSTARSFRSMTPVLSSSSEGSSPRTIGRTFPLGGLTGSEDADDDYDGTDGNAMDSPSESSESITFSPKRVRLRHRNIAETKTGLGLSLQPEADMSVVDLNNVPDNIPALIARRIVSSGLLSLRLLAVVPSAWGICVLLDALRTGGLWVEVWPWGVDISREALERLVAGRMADDGMWRPVDRGDIILAIAWATCTAHFCFELTTGLTHRWRSYYPLLSTFLRLVSLQCLCWPATYLTLWFLGARRPLLAWIVIGVTTGWSRTVQMWVTSNVVSGEVTPRASIRARPPPLKPEGMSWWESFTWGRRWDWDAIAREVGWKVGGLLLVTTAWIFWGFETGRYVEMHPQRRQGW